MDPTPGDLVVHIANPTNPIVVCAAGLLRERVQPIVEQVVAKPFKNALGWLLGTIAFGACRNTVVICYNKAEAKRLGEMLPALLGTTGDEAVLSDYTVALLQATPSTPESCKIFPRNKYIEKNRTTGTFHLVSSQCLPTAPLLRRF